MTNSYTVKLENGKIGELDSSTLNGQNAENFMGETVRIQGQEKNGHVVEFEGILTEILES